MTNLSHMMKFNILQKVLLIFFEGNYEVKDN